MTTNATNFPETAEARRAGMASVRARVLASKQRVLASNLCADSKGRARALTAAERAQLQDDVARIQATQQRNDE